jgi:hypothetical protein
LWNIILGRVTKKSITSGVNFENALKADSIFRQWKIHCGLNGRPKAIPLGPLRSLIGPILPLGILRPAVTIIRFAGRAFVASTASGSGWI